MNVNEKYNPGDYFEITFHVKPAAPWLDLLPQDLANLGFESFQEEENETLKGFIPAAEWSSVALDEYLKTLPLHLEVNYNAQKIDHENWNKTWESNFEPVKIGKQLLIRAPFHLPDSSVNQEIVMVPKMAFGTGHHDTTYQIAAELLQTSCEDEKVMDMGCGTGVLAILAAKRGAKEVWAVDIDPLSVSSTRENAVLNNTPGFTVLQGVASDIRETGFGLLLANINRNIILDQLPHYARMTKPGGYLMTSGFYTEDADQIKTAAKAVGFQYVKSTARHNWAMLILKKR